MISFLRQPGGPKGHIHEICNRFMLDKQPRCDHNHVHIQLGPLALRHCFTTVLPVRERIPTEEIVQSSGSKKSVCQSQSVNI